jgi:signal transduction histidine kinase
MAKIRARARAVDMLGRQQIAGIQNAISELFKNAHDAYANMARVDYIESHKLILVRDDGVGMTTDDFENRWLVLGTESKLGAERDKHFRPPEMAVRPVTGEKGIGRLSIALLGRQVLVLSRARRKDGLHDLVAGLVHWGLFELPGLNLDDIEIPVKTIAGGKLPTVGEIAELTARLVKSLDSIAKDHPELKLAAIRREVLAFKPDPEDLHEFMEPHDEGKLSLTDSGTGTHFIIGPTNEIVAMELAAEDRLADYSFRKQLVGFCNEVFLASPPPPIATSFRYWRPGAIVGEELLNSADFFTPDELAHADHSLSGSIDKFGQFKGALRVYEKEYPDLQIPWPDSLGHLTEVGPFEVTFGYIMGTKSESKLAPEEFDLINGKVDRIGGMYVYRDKIRVLPYGDHSFDWLEVEKRRNKGAGYYFFSFRRMFGAVILTKAQNSNLVEKAGREGWQQNKAFRQLKDILVNLLQYLAAEFFRKGGSFTEIFEQHQLELRHKAELLAKREKQVSVRKKQFAAALDKFTEAVAAGLPNAAVATAKQQMHQAMQLAAALPDQDQAAAALIRAEKQATETVKTLRLQYSCKKPGGVGLSRELSHRWNLYQEEREQLESELFVPLENEVTVTLGKVAKQARIYINQRKRLEERLQSIQEERQKSLREAIDQARNSANDTRNTVLEVTQRAVQSFDGVYKQIETDMNRIDFQQLGDAEIEKLRRRWEEQLLEVEQRHRESLEAARDMLSALSANLRSSDESGRPQMMDKELVEAIEERMLTLEEQADEDFEMVQMGMAVAIINHEFAAAIHKVRHSVKELGYLARGSAGIRPLYESIRSNFEHLDSHLNLFTPLQRRLNRKATIITGNRMREYIQDLFSNRLMRHKVNLVCTESFTACSIECYPSTIYPVIINLVDNAIFWLGTEQSKSAGRMIQLDAEEGALIVSNNGPKIPKRDEEAVFTRGFTRKSGGRGLGLFIARRALQKEEMDINLPKTTSDDLAVSFRLSIPTLKLTNDS